MMSSEELKAFNARTVQVPGGHIFWTGVYHSRTNYGIMRLGGRYRYAHVISLENKLGRKLKEGMLALHACSVSACVNPAHLYEGSASQNNLDAWRAGTRYKLNPEGRASLLKEIRNGVSIPKACKKYGVNRNWYADHLRLVRLGRRKQD